MGHMHMVTSLQTGEAKPNDGMQVYRAMACAVIDRALRDHLGKPTEKDPFDPDEATKWLLGEVPETSFWFEIAGIGPFRIQDLVGINLASLHRALAQVNREVEETEV